MLARTASVALVALCLGSAVVAQQSSAGKAQVAPTVSIFSVREDGKGRQLVSRRFRFPGVSVAFSPDGTRVLYERGGLWIARADGTARKRLTPRKIRAYFHGGAAFSPDGRRVAFVGTAPVCDDCTSTIYVVGTDGRGLRRIGLGENPSWAPDSRRLTYNTVGTFSVIVVGRNGVKRELARGHGPVWAPRGERIAYTPGPPGGGSGNGYSFALCFVNANATSRRCISARGAFTHLLWAPDGKHVAFYDGGIAIATSDARGWRRLTGTGLAEHAPLGWSPDSSRVAFRRVEWSTRESQESQIYTRRIHGPSRGRRVTSEPADTTFGDSVSWRRGRITYAAGSVPCC